MNNIEVEINTDQIIKLFESLTSKQQKIVFRNALRQAGNILVKQTRQNLRKSLKNPSASRSKNRWNGQTMESGIKLNVRKSGQAAKVNIMADFRLKFFEMGTTERWTGKKTLKRKKHRTGRIQATHFFQQAKQQKEGEVFKTLQELVAKNIVKVWSKSNKPAMKNLLNQ